MRIAMINYEYPPDTADGGIATYAAQAARMLARRGHHVEVFTATRRAASSASVGGVLVHRVLEADVRRFAETIAPVFAARHAQVGFDVLEGPDYNADARAAARLVPDIPRVVKLHTPQFMISRVDATEERPLRRWRQTLAAALRGRRPGWHPLHEKHQTEREHVLAADEVAASTQAIARLIRKAWRVPEDRISCFPLPFTPEPALLAIPSDTQTRCVTCLGRIAVAKGILDLAAAIPLVLRKHPDVTFRLVGSPMYWVARGFRIEEYLREQLRPWAGNVRFERPVAPSQVPAVLAGTDICVLPSLWEAFGLAGLESLAAARGVICAGGSGLEEVVQRGRFGLVVPPRSPGRLAAAICRLLEDPPLRMALGEAGRQHVLDAFGDDVVGPQQEASYRRAVARKAQANALASDAAHAAGAARTTTRTPVGIA